MDMNRRQFLRGAAAAGAAAMLPGCRGARRPSTGGGSSGDDRKFILVQFGGGTRSSEAIDDPQHRWIPRLWNDMVPCGTLFTNMRVEHKVVHPNSTGSLMTGFWEWDDLDWSRPVAHPTVFEIHRKVRGRPDTDAWALVYASILAKSAESRAKGHGGRYAANVVEPPTIPRSTAETMDRLMAAAAASGSKGAELAAAKRCADLARSTSRVETANLRSAAARRFFADQYATWKRAAEGTTSHDAFLTDRAIACMRQFAPSVLAVCYGEIDCAHYGSWSRYTEAIARTDALTRRLWEAAQTLEAYRGRTLMLIVPDHGRELERPGGAGFVHHSNFYTNEGADEGCRRVWMLALGPGVKAGRTVERPAPITAVAATALEYLDLPTTPGSAGSVLKEAT